MFNYRFYSSDNDKIEKAIDMKEEYKKKKSTSTTLVIIIYLFTKNKWTYKKVEKNQITK